MASYDDTATVSGSIAYFSDGADDVPSSSVKVTIPASLSGVSAVSVVNSGKNLLNIDRTEGTPSPTDVLISPRILDTTKLYKGLRADNYYYANYVEYSINNGVIYVTTKNNQRYGVAFPVEVKENTTYILSATKTGTSMSVGCYDAQWNFIERVFDLYTSNTPKTFTTSANAKYITVVFGSYTLDTEGTVSDIQLEYGSTASAYTPYIAPTTYTASLGRTIYGGEVDIVNGTGTDENGNDFTFTGQEIPTRLGYNAFWSEQGNTELTYYKSGYGFTSVTIHKETPDGEPVEQTAKFHRIVYGGTADVVKGTCEPKNLYNDKNLTQGLPATTIGSSIDTINTSTIRYSYNGFVPPNGNIAISAERNDTNVVAAILFYGYKDGLLTDYRGINPFGTNPITIDCSSFDYVRIAVGSVNAQTQVPLDMTDYGYIQAEVGSSKSDYSPYFDSFTFPPISMSTDEGENTLFANEGDSVITYRKETD